MVFFRHLLEWLRYLWWRSIESCWNCGGYPQLPGRHICQPCSLRGLHLSTRQILTVKK